MQPRKRSKPALYELMKGQRIYSPAQPPPPPAIVRSDDDGEDDHSAATSMPALTWLDRLRAGHALRIPVGYVFLVIPAVLIIVVIAYMFGFTRGDTGTDEPVIPTPGFAVNDPLARPLLNEAGKPPANTTRPSGGNATSTTPKTAALLSIDVSKLGPIESDPRQRGLNYHVLATTHHEGAMRLATFCRQHGLAAYVVPARGKPSLRQVILLPGFDREALKSEVADQFKRMILDVGQKWDKQEPGSDDLSSFILQRYDG